jgi:O-antigen/teichoic acid export membrane protein
MSLIAKQSIYNFITISIAFIIGAINTLFLYPTYPGKEFQGLVVALLATSNLLQPFISFGVQHALIKFYSSYSTKEDRDNLLWFSIYFPIIIILALVPFIAFLKPQIISFLTNVNVEIEKYLKMIFYIAILTAYFEIFFSWLRIQLKTVFGNFLKEFYPRLLIFSLLTFYVIGLITLDQFVDFLLIGYFIRLLIVAIYSFYVYTPSFKINLPKKITSILKYNILIFLSGAAASIILDIDKSMIYSMLKAENVAFYVVALFIATVIEAPGRGLFQISSPLVASAINKNDIKRLEVLLKKTSINLIVICGFIFIVINTNLIELYQVINQEGYSNALSVIWIVSIGKLFSMSMGCINNIISNSKYYPYIFWFSLISGFSAIALNLFLIEKYGIIGAAYATLGVIIFINTCKLILILVKFKIHPYSYKTIHAVILIIILFYIMNQVSFILNPLFVILIKGGISFIVFSFLIIKLKISENINQLYNNGLRSSTQLVNKILSGK